MALNKTKLFSDEQLVALSKVFEAAIFWAASVRLAVSSTTETTLPAPTPKAGVPQVEAARILACEPVATTRSACCIRACVASLVMGAGRNCTRSVGAFIRRSCACTNSTKRTQVLSPLGEGATITALPAFKAFITLFAGVAPGLVDGVMAATTPTGRAISVMPLPAS